MSSAAWPTMHPTCPPIPGVEGAVSETVTGLRAPIVAHWAVTYRCNLRCGYCYAESGPWREPGPGAEVRRRIVERLAAWGVLEVALGGGEPTAAPRFRRTPGRDPRRGPGRQRHHQRHEPPPRGHPRAGRARRGGPPVGRPTRVPRRRARRRGFRPAAADRLRPGRGRCTSGRQPAADAGQRPRPPPQPGRGRRIGGARRDPVVSQGGLGRRPLAGLPRSPRPGGRGRGRARASPRAARPYGCTSIRPCAGNGPGWDCSTTPSRTWSAAEAGSGTSPSHPKATSIPALTPDTPGIAWATS